ncbi:MAG: hypothetical protein ACK5JT_17670 [Hyphomicrobiaceae bacterium]
MLTELPEADATGEIAEIFAEIRQLYATPYVSSIHRHLATRPGVLEWAWKSVAPVFRSGQAQDLAWAAARRESLAPLTPIPREVLAYWGIGAVEIAQIKGVAQSFTRVAPVNMVFGGLIADVLLAGTELAGGVAAGEAGADAVGREGAWMPPALLPSPPAMVDAAELANPERDVLQLFRSGTGETAFVPGLYRMLAHWPGLLAHLAVELGQKFNSSEKSAAAERLLAGTRIIVAEVAPQVAWSDGGPASNGPEAAHLRRMIAGYRVTSPEMILFGRLVEDALPPG